MLAIMTELNSRPLAAADALTAVSRIIEARRVRESFFRAGLFSEPAWDILLALFLGELRQQRIATSDLARTLAISLTVALRWIDALEQEGLVRRYPDRMTFVSLSARGSTTMHSWLARSIELQKKRPTGEDQVLNLLSRIHGKRS